MREFGCFTHQCDRCFAGVVQFCICCVYFIGKEMHICIYIMRKIIDNMSIVLGIL